jgi:tetratricopeptide (TPR) repeat protein
MLKIYPPVRGDKDFIKRYSRAKKYEGKEDDGLNLFLKGIENYERENYNKAEINFDEALSLEPKRFIIRGYLASTLLNQGKEYMNLKNQDPGKVIDLCERALKIFPGHIEALYYLMIENVRIGNFERSANFAEKIIEESKYFQQPSLSLLGQSYLHLAWGDYANNQTDQSWKNYIKSINQAKWKE